MKWLGLLLALITSASGAGAQTIIGYPTCAAGEAAYRAAPHDATRDLASVHTITTDGFGARYVGPTGRPLRAEGIGATTILSDGGLAWRPRTDAQVVERCPGVVRVLRDLNMGQGRGLLLAAEVGNETGDPGPLRYLDPSLPNVDKIGPDYEATLSLGPSLTSVRWRDFLPTDPAIAPRVFDAVEGRFPKRKGLVGTSTLDLYPLVAHVDGLVAEDLPFEETLGREVPTLRRQLGGSVALHHGWSDLSAGLEHAQLDRPSWSRLGVLGPDWRQTSATISLDHGYETRTSVRLRPIWADGPGLRDGSVFWGEGGVEHGAVSARLSGGPSGIGGGVGVQPHAIHLGGVFLVGEAHAHRQLPESAPGLPFWVARGYSGLASETTPLALGETPRPLESASLHLSGRRWWHKIPDPFSAFALSFINGATVDVSARRGETVYLPSFRLADDAVAVSGPVQAISASGTVAEVEVRAGWNRQEVVFDAPPALYTHLTTWARARFVLAGDDAFRAAREREPAVRLGALAEHSPDGKLNLRARLEWRSATHWEGWPDPDVPAALLLDLGGEYTFGAFTATLTGRNVLGAPEQTHPLGATLDGRLFVRLAARLGG